jgi:required for meiotic nuclear division protein 1
VISGTKPEQKQRGASVDGLVTLYAVHAFERIDVRSLSRQTDAWLASSPTTLRLSDQGLAVCLRYGVVVFVNASESVQNDFLDFLAELGNARSADNIESERVMVGIDPSAGDDIRGEKWTLADASIPRLQLVCMVLARSVIMASYEAALREATNLVGPLADELAQSGRSRRRSRVLLQQIGNALSIRHALVGRAEVTEKPDVLWDRPEFERLYHQLIHDLELNERNAALEAKLNLISEASHTALDLLQQSKTLRVEWYIVILIIVEILLSLLHRV